MAIYLSFKEIWYNKGRFLLIAMIVALITTLVLFVAALSEGLGAGNREFLEKLNGELVVYQENVDLSIAASRIGRSELSRIRRINGVSDLGQIGVSTASLIQEEGDPIDVALFGVEPGKPGEPEVRQGRQLGRTRANEVIIDQRIVDQTGLGPGDIVTIKSIQGTEEKFFDLNVVGTTDGRAYFVQPGFIVPYLTWEKIRPQAGAPNPREGEFISNLVAVRLENPAEIDEVATRMKEQVSGIDVVDRKTAYEATPGYAEQQSTLSTQRYFSFLIGILVIGGFFQIQTLQKVAQIGMLKAIGASNRTIALSAIAQIVTINAFGVLIGAAGTFALSFGLPVTVPVIFTGGSVASAVIALMLIGPLGGLVSVWLLLRVEPLTALGLAQ